MAEAQKENGLVAKICILCIIGGVLILAACGGSDEKTPDQTQQPTSGGNGGLEVGKEEFGLTEEGLVTHIEDTETAIAACMAGEGFEYIPVDPVTFRNGMASLGSVPGLSDEEFVAQYGYGYTTLPPKQKFDFGEENVAIFNALPASDQVAYERALLGENTQATFVYMLENEDFEGAGGCTKAAIEEVFSAEQRNPNFTNPFDVQVAQDPRVIDATEKWGLHARGRIRLRKPSRRRGPDHRWVRCAHQRTGSSDAHRKRRRSAQGPSDRGTSDSRSRPAVPGRVPQAGRRSGRA